MSHTSHIVAMLGPTNTGKTHRAIERMLEHASGIIGLPLRLLAREVFDRVAARVGRDQVALITGEEKLVPRRARYFVSTVEAMPVEREVAFVAIDEIQLVAHRERGHVFTDRMLHARGTEETWFMGSDTIRPLLTSLVPTARAEAHPRLSRLAFAGASKLSRLPPRSAVVAFSIDRVYELAERLQRTRGGAAVVLGALSPRTRNAQVAMFQAGEVDTIVATDAIGMGLNLDVAHVAFAARHKFDGRELRELDDAELAQIAGRAGRYVTDGTFGTIAPIELSPHVVSAIEGHRFAPVRRAFFRPHLLDFSSAAALLESLRAPPHRQVLTPIPSEGADDEEAFARLGAMPEIKRTLRSTDEVKLLWEVASIPDFRKLLFEAHVDDLRTIFLELIEHGRVRDELFERALAPLSRDAHDVDELLGRIAALRTWSYVANKDRWPADPERWRGETRALEDRLSDALHSALTARFVTTMGKRRPSPARASSRQLPAPGDDEFELHAVSKHHPFARLREFAPRAKAVSSTVVSEVDALSALVDAPHESFELRSDGTIVANDLALARLARGPRVTLPQIRMLDVPSIGPGLRSRLERRLLAYARDVASRLLAPLDALRASTSAPVRGLAHSLEAGLGTARERDVREVTAAMNDADRALIASRNIVIARDAAYAADLLSPEAIATRAILLRAAGRRVPRVPPGAQSIPRKGDDRVLLALGFVPRGRRAVRADVATSVTEERDES